MNRIISVKINPNNNHTLFFFLIFLGVKNLTDKFESFNDFQPIESFAQNNLSNEKIVDNLNQNSSDDNVFDKKTVTNKTDFNDTSYSNNEPKEEIKNDKDKEIIKKTIPKSFNTKDTSNFSSANDTLVKNSLQFGAFSKKKKMLIALKIKLKNR